MVLGGYRNHAQARFATILGGSKNTVNGRFGIAMGYNAKVTGDYSGAIALFPDEALNQNGVDSTQCLVRDEDTLNICANSLTVNGDDIMALFSRGRALSETLDGVSELAKTADSDINALRKQGAALDEAAARMLQALAGVSSSSV